MEDTYAYFLEFRLWEDGWKDRYYETKFGVGQEDLEFRHKVVSLLQRT